MTWLHHSLNVEVSGLRYRGGTFWTSIAGVTLVSCTVGTCAMLLCITGSGPMVMGVRQLAAAFSRLEPGLMFDCPCTEPCIHIRRGYRPPRDCILVELHVMVHSHLTKEPRGLPWGVAGGKADWAASLRYCRTAGWSRCTCSLGSRLSHSSRCSSHLQREQFSCYGDRPMSYVL